MEFAESVEPPNKAERENRAQRFRELGEAWKSRPLEEIRAKVRKQELAAYAKGFLKTLVKNLESGTQDILHDVNRADVDLHSELYWHAFEAGHNDPQTAAFNFLRDRLEELPCLRIESILLERLALQLSKFSARPANLGKLRVDNTAYDIEACSYFIPYVDAAQVDRKMISTLQEARHQLASESIPWSRLYS